jgi:hypothetical protein
MGQLTQPISVFLGGLSLDKELPTVPFGEFDIKNAVAPLYKPFATVVAFTVKLILPIKATVSPLYRLFLAT